jgi:hypothetical protein
MVDAKRLLTDLKRLHRDLLRDLRGQHASSLQRAAAQAEWQEAFDAKRTADTFETFWTAAIDQAAVHWILGVVFLRFLEDNRLLDRPFLSGPGERLELAQARQAAYVRQHPMHIDTDYLLDMFAEAARLPGLAGLYDPEHNPLFRLPLSGDGAIALLAFFRARVPETGELVHDFTDADWNTRFMGDLYQDLSEDARKRFALLQTPDFVEEWILDRTLDPAMREFGHAEIRMIDPTCGSGHFLLGGFARVLAAWQREAPEMPPAAQAQKALDAMSGVDLNPFAVEIARFRLLLAALAAAREARLAAAPDFRFSLAVGDSLLHGQHFGRQRDLSQEMLEGFQRRLLHHFVTEDTVELDRILGRQYHAVVGNPPYITPKDPAMRDAYREIYRSCYGAYALSAPFMERFFDLALSGEDSRTAGFVGLIVANSFMKREFGAKLIEAVLPQLDLTHVVDCSGAYIPGHGTPTVIIFGRNRPPLGSSVRTVMGIRGEPSAPSDPAQGLVWSAIVTQTDVDGSKSQFISVSEVPRMVLARHPWSIGGGGALDVKQLVERSGSQKLMAVVSSIGFGAVTREDDAYLMPASAAKRHGVEPGFVRPMVEGEAVRDYQVAEEWSAVWPYDSATLNATCSAAVGQLYWPLRVRLRDRVAYGQSQIERGLNWFEYSMFFRDRYRTALTITFGEVATHNHFVLDRGGKVFNRTAPVIKLPAGTTEDEHLGLVGLLNSSMACFWLKQVCYPKGGDHVGQEGARVQKTKWDERYAFNGGNVQNFPLVSPRPLSLARQIDTEAQVFSANLPVPTIARVTPTQSLLETNFRNAVAARARMIALQEELDWRCYRLYGLLGEAPEHPDPPPLQLGQRAFEIVMARQIEAGTLETAWFTRHRSTPITDLPAHWLEDYRAIVERRIELIETNPAIGLIERPEYKRRWSMDPWEDMESDALRIWLLDRLEDPRYWPPTDPVLTSTRALADATRHDTDFLSVAALYAGHDRFDLEALVAELVAKEAVPFLSVLRYSETGLRRRADWEATWDKQRAEDAIDADLASQREDFLRAAWTRANRRGPEEAADAYAARMAAGLHDPAIGQAAEMVLTTEAKRRKQAEIGTIPVPPKYKTADFRSSDFWRLRGGLDVPKERFVSFPHCARDADGSLPVLWAGYDHLAHAKAIAAWYVERKDTDGWQAPRLIPLLAGLLELVPWLRQWHNGRDPETGLHMGDYFGEFIEDEARSLGLTLAELTGWAPPAPVRRTRGRRAAS